MASSITSVTQPGAQAAIASQEARARERPPVDNAERRAAAPKAPENPPSPTSEAAQVRLSAEGRARSAAQEAGQKEAAAAAQNAAPQRQSEAVNQTTAKGVAAYLRVFNL